MSWQNCSIALAPAGEAAPARPAHEVHRALWSEGVVPLLERALKGRAYRGIVRGGYLSSQATGGFDSGKWGYTDGALWFRFFEATGLFALAALATAHFTEVALALLARDPTWTARLAGEGWRLEPARDLEAVLRDAATPLLVVDDVLYAVEPGAPPRVWTDPRLPQRAFASFAASERALLTAAATQRRCGCALCEHLRALVAKTKARAQPRAVPARAGATASAMAMAKPKKPAAAKRGTTASAKAAPTKRSSP